MKHEAEKEKEKEKEKKKKKKKREGKRERNREKQRMNTIWTELHSCRYTTIPYHVSCIMYPVSCTI